MEGLSRLSILTTWEALPSRVVLPHLQSFLSFQDYTSPRLGPQQRGRVAWAPAAAAVAPASRCEGVEPPVQTSVSTQQWLPGDFQVIKGQIRKELRKIMEGNRVNVRREGSREPGGTRSILTSQIVSDLGMAEAQSFRQALK